MKVGGENQYAGGIAARLLESVIETKASTILEFIHGLSRDLRVTFEERTWAT
ncbi:MAG TPA: hypothetical protein VGU64_06735 [Terriglobales bacterium]|nr:hypothetical protein [Terriglobales bacterium]